MSNNKWRNWRAPSFYKDIKECYVKPEEWLTCPDCDEKPRLWIFDNGEFAKCKCQDTYGEAAATGISIWDYHNAHNGNMSGWNHNDLRDNWNKRVEQIISTLLVTGDKEHENILLIQQG